MKTNPASLQIFECEKMQQMHLSDDKQCDHLPKEKLETDHPNHQSESNDNSLVERNCRVRWFDSHVRMAQKHREVAPQDFYPFS